MKRALASFATARALNAVISVAQGTELSAQPLGVGVNVAPGQVLDPVNDMVEQFANLMLAASVSFGVQKMLIGIGGYWLVSLLLTVAVVARAWVHLGKLQPPAWLTSVLVLLLLVRFAVPLTTLGSDWLFQEFLADDYRASQKVIDTASGQTAKLDPSIGMTAADKGLLDKMKDWLSQNVDVKARFEELKEAAEQAIEHMITLIVIFLLQTLVIPTLILWGLYHLARSAMTGSPRPPGTGQGVV
ncbi:MAG: hypothetical protein EHM83_03920 [Burkholderiales bacterium]|nr:MAG: hypothetical protein EHM83_03920 [Burkholderiales bacterium]